MSKFMLLLHDSPAAIQTFRQLSPEQMQKAVDKYMAWTKKPFCVDSKRLSMDAGRVIRSENGTPRVIDGPYSETKEVLGGYYLIEAENYDQAVNLSLDHPHLEHGGTIVVRELYRM